MKDIFLNEYYLDGKQDFSTKIISILDSMDIELSENLNEFIYKFSYLITSIYGYNSNKNVLPILANHIINKKDYNYTYLSDCNGVIYIPSYGYIFTNQINKPVKLKWKDDSFLPMEKMDNQYIKEKLFENTNICIEQYNHEFLFNFYNEQKRRGTIHNQQLNVQNSVSIFDQIQKALDTINLIDSTQYQEINQTISRIVVGQHNNMTGFTSIEASGLSFFFPRYFDNYFFYIDHLIHNSSHYKLDFCLIDPKRFFCIDPFELRFSSPLKIQKRGLYHCIHAIYVLLKIASFFSKYINTISHNYEPIGRFLISFHRARLGLKTINGRFYTEDGNNLIELLNFQCEQLAIDCKEVIDKYTIVNQEKEFNLNNFIIENNL